MQFTCGLDARTHTGGHIVAGNFRMAEVDYGAMNSIYEEVGRSHRRKPVMHRGGARRTDSTTYETSWDYFMKVKADDEGKATV